MAECGGHPADDGAVGRGNALGGALGGRARGGIAGAARLHPAHGPLRPTAAAAETHVADDVRDEALPREHEQ